MGEATRSDSLVKRAANTFVGWLSEVFGPAPVPFASVARSTPTPTSSLKARQNSNGTSTSGDVDPLEGLLVDESGDPFEGDTPEMDELGYFEEDPFDDGSPLVADPVKQRIKSDASLSRAEKSRLSRERSLELLSRSIASNDSDLSEDFGAPNAKKRKGISAAPSSTPSRREPVPRTRTSKRAKRSDSATNSKHYVTKEDAGDDLIIIRNPLKFDLEEPVEVVGTDPVSKGQTYTEYGSILIGTRRFKIGELVYLKHERRNATPREGESRPWIGQIMRIVIINDGYCPKGFEDLGRYLVHIQWAYLDEHLPKHLRSRLKANELTWSDVRDWNPIAAIDQLGHPITTKLIPGGDPDNYVNEKTGDTWFVRYFFDTQTAQLVAAKY